MVTKFHDGDGTPPRVPSRREVLTSGATVGLTALVLPTAAAAATGAGLGGGEVTTTTTAVPTTTTTVAPAAGVLDTGFVPNLNSDVRTVAIQSDGKILVGGTFTSIGGTARKRFLRLNTNGTLDTGFVDPVVSAADDTGISATIRVDRLAIQTDGKIIIAGIFTTVGGETRNGLARLNTDGSLDTGFDPQTSNATTVTCRRPVIQPDGKIVICGDFTSVRGETRNRIARLNSDGTLDTGFNPNANAAVESLALQADGKILVAGQFTTIGGGSRTGLARLNADGTLDTNFNPGTASSVFDLLIEPGGSIVAVGNFTTFAGGSRNRVARLDASGTLDALFDPNANNFVNRSRLLSNGQIVITGNFTSIGGVTRNRIARLNANGSLDTSFDPDANSTAFEVAEQSDGKLVVGGVFTNIGGAARNYIARLI